MDFFNTILLLIAVTALGAFSRHKELFSSDDKIVLNGFVFRFALPALLIHTISNMEFNALKFEIIIASVVPILVAVFLMVALHLLRFITKKQMILASITLAFGSNAFFGIAYFDALYGEKAMEFAVFSGGLLGMVGIFFAVSFLEYGVSGKVKLSAVINILKSPPIFAIFIGIAMALLGVELAFFDKASNLLGKTAGGLAIFVLGMFIYDVFSVELIKHAFAYVLLRALLLPLVTYITLLLLPNFSEQLYAYLLQQSGIPAGISIAIIAQRYNYHYKELSMIVILSSLLSFIVLGFLYLMSN